MYDAAKNIWTPVKGSYGISRRRIGWHSPAYSARDDAVLVYAHSSREATFAYRLDPATGSEARPGRAGGTSRLYLDWDARMAKLPAQEPAANIEKMPANRWVEMPGPSVPTKNWGSATVDTEKGVILYIGGGHSTYSGTDTAHYDIGAGRWSLSYPPEFPPFLRATSRTVFGWSYNQHPWAEHTRKWYAYDPVSRMMVYARQGAGNKWITIHPDGADAKGFKPSGYCTMIYDPHLRQWYTPTWDRPWRTGDSSRLISTPNGVYAHAGGIWHCNVEKVGAGDKAGYVGKWKQVFKEAPGTGSEFDATVYDSKRNRLVILTGSGKKPAMTFFDLGTGKSEKALPEGKWNFFREACYIPDQDVIFTPDGYNGLGYYVYRCAQNKWIKVDIAPPMSGGKPIQRGAGKSSAAIVYDPVHKVLFYFSIGAPVNLMRYDDKSVKVRAEGGSREN